MARLEFNLPDELAARIRQEAAALNQTLSAWAVGAFQSLFSAQKPAIPREIPSDPKLALLEQIEQHYHLSVAARNAKVPLVDVEEWLTDPAFQGYVGMAQDCFVEQIEAEMLAIGRGERKGNFGALCAFLNAHHPQYGIKSELMSRILGDIIEQFYGVVTEQVGEDLAASLKNLLREVAEKKLVQFKR